MLHVGPIAVGILSHAFQFKIEIKQIYGITVAADNVQAKVATCSLDLAGASCQQHSVSVPDCGILDNKHLRYFNRYARELKVSVFIDTTDKIVKTVGNENKTLTRTSRIIHQ